MGRQIPPKVWAKYERLRGAGVSRSEAASAVGISYQSATRYDSGEIATDGVAVVKTIREAAAAAESEVPKSYDELSDEARRALEDFSYFRQRYLGRKATPWQGMAAELVLELLDTEEREWLVINVPPGSGKSTTFTHDIPAWLICRDRFIRALIGSRTGNQAAKYSGRLRRTLELTRPMAGAAATLVGDFGPFKPAMNELWRRSEFIVWQHAEEQPVEKEPTVSAVGMDTGFLGGRFDFVIWDDLVDASTTRTEESRLKQQEWFENEAETRLEPGGLFILQGQRLAPNDLYRYALDLEDPDLVVLDDRDDSLDLPDLRVVGQEDPAGAATQGVSKRPGFKYKHVIFKAHYEELCQGGGHTDVAAYPDGCLLDPERLTFRYLTQVKHNNPRRFDIIMQQQDVDPEGTLVPMEFIQGGMWNGIQLPGCLDEDRRLCELPPGLDRSDLISVLTVDPSPTKFWAIQWWVCSPSTQMRFLMDQHRQAMDAPDFLDRLRDGTYVGIAEEWARRATNLGLPLEFVIVEHNAAQRFMLQTNFFQEWVQLRGVSLIPHATHQNKADPEFGVQSLRPHYQYGRVRLPWGDPQAKQMSRQLIDEVTVWPNGTTDDTVMAQWFLEWNLPNLEAATAPLPKNATVPEWVKKEAVFR